MIPSPTARSGTQEYLCNRRKESQISNAILVASTKMLKGNAMFFEGTPMLEASTKMLKGNAMFFAGTPMPFDF